MPIQNLTNLYEVTKTLTFELVPTPSTKKRLPVLPDSQKYLSHPDSFFSQAKVAITLLQSRLARLSSGEIVDIIAGKDLMKYLDRHHFESRKKDIKNNLYLSKILKNTDGWLWFQEYFSSKIEYLSEKLNLAVQYLNISRTELLNPTKWDTIRAMKQVAHSIWKWVELLDLLEIDYGKEVEYLKEWKDFQKWNADFFVACRSIFRSMKINGEVEWSKCTMNHRAINKNADLQKIHINLENAQIDFARYDQEKSEWAKKISDWNEKNSQEKTKKENELIWEWYTWEKLKKELEYWRETFSTYEVETRERNGKIQKITLKKKKNEASKKVWEVKQKIHALEEEIYRQESLGYYSRLIRIPDGRYYLAMIEKNKKDQLLHLRGGTTAEVLGYHSLTFKALMKLIEKWACDIRLHTPIQTIEKIRYPEKNLKYPATPIEKKDYLSELARALHTINQKLEDNQFSWKSSDLDAVVESGDISQFQLFVNENCYVKKWIHFDWQSIQDLDTTWEIFLFQLYTQDFPLPLDRVEKLKQEKGENYFDKPRKDPKKENLFTQYWRDCLESQLTHIHIAPESRLYMRPPKAEKELSLRIGKEEFIGQHRFRESKIVGDFQLVFYPAKKSTVSEIHKKINTELSGEEISFIGIDRGEWSIANYMILDQYGHPRRDTNGKVLKGDMTIVSVDWGFVEMEDCIFWNGKKEIEVSKWVKWGIVQLRNIKKVLSYDFPVLKWNEIEWSAIDIITLNAIKNKLETEIHPNLLSLSANGVRVFDYRYAFNHMRFSHRVLYEIQKREPFDSENIPEWMTIDQAQQAYFGQLLDSEKIRWGYVSAFVSSISRMVEKYNAYVVFEDMSNIYDRGNSGTAENYLSGISEELLTPRQKNVMKWISVYQMIEQRLINKLGYLRNRDTMGKQTAPRVENLGYLRYTTPEQLESIHIQELQKEWGDTNRIGNILYVSEHNTSKECPLCWEKLFRNKWGSPKKGLWDDQCFHDTENPGKGDCIFDTKTHPYIHSGDELAAYNIANRWIAKWKKDVYIPKGTLSARNQVKFSKKDATSVTHESNDMIPQWSWKINFDFSQIKL